MKTALITGASGGIGGAIVKKFIQNGYFVFGQYNTNEKGIDVLAKEIANFGKADYFCPVKFDITKTEQIDSAVSSILKSFRHVDVLVNNAGAGLYKMVTETTTLEWDSLFNVNVKGVYYLTNKILPRMIEKKAGKIINVSSIWGNSGASMEVGYSASKSALIGYTKALAKELAPSNINVNCVCPGVIDTAMNSRFTKCEIEQLIEETPLARLGQPSDVAGLIYFLATEEANFITGQNITIDGGFTL